ncbi:MAG: dihydrofolate reductase [Pseudomonadota bacterium]
MDLHYHIVVAMTENRIIGSNNAMPWRQSSDLKHFKMLTYGKPIIMGRKTFQTIGKPLEGRNNIVITRNPDFHVEGVRIAFDLHNAKSWAYEYAKESNVEEAMIIGGAEIYQLFLPEVSRIYLTEIHTQLEGDTKFPELDMSQWEEVKRVRHQAGPKDDYDFSFIVLDRSA